MGAVIFWALISVVFSFLCSILEAVLLSVTPNFISSEVRKGSSTGIMLQKYKEDIDRPLSAILTLNTIAHTVGAIMVGSAAGDAFGENYVNIGGMMELSYESIVAVVMTLIILYASEIIPKTIGANFWQSLAPFTVQTLRILMFILFPLVWVSKWITKFLKKPQVKSVLSRHDFAAIVEEGSEGGSLDASEAKIIKNLLQFEKQTVRDIMTPKTVAFMGSQDETIEDFYKNNQPIRYSRIPIYGETRDDIIGLVLKDEILQKVADDDGKGTLSSIKRNANFTQDDKPLPALFQELTKEKNHLFVVTDNFGAVVGLVSMEDLFETLLGQEIVDEYDNVEDLQKLAKKKWAAKKKNT